jgi:hypothetical protein
MKVTTTFALLALLVAGCHTTPGPPPEMAKESVLHSPVQVLQIRFDMTGSEIRMTNLRRAFGAPTETIITGRAVAVTAMSENDEVVVAMATVENPLAVRTAGSTKPARAVREKGHFIVNFAHPELIRTVRVEVREGPGKDMAANFDIPPMGEWK